MIIQNAEGLLIPTMDGRTDHRGTFRVGIAHSCTCYVRPPPHSYSCRNARKAQQTRSWTWLHGKQGEEAREREEEEENEDDAAAPRP